MHLNVGTEDGTNPPTKQGYRFTKTPPPQAPNKSRTWRSDFKRGDRQTAARQEAAVSYAWLDRERGGSEQSHATLGGAMGLQSTTRLHVDPFNAFLVNRAATSCIIKTAVLFMAKLGQRLAPAISRSSVSALS